MRWCQRAGPVDPHPYALVGDARSIQNGSKISLGPVDRVSKESNSVTVGVVRKRVKMPDPLVGAICGGLSSAATVFTFLN